MGSLKNEWTDRNTKIHKRLVIEIMSDLKKEGFIHKLNQKGL